MFSPTPFSATRRRLLSWSGCVLLLMLLATGSSAAQLADAPWPSFGGDLQNTGQSSYGGDGQSWQATFIEAAQTGPAIAEDGTIYVGGGSFGNTTLHALNPDSTERWAYTPPNGLNARTIQPVIGNDGTVYIGGEDDVGNGVLYALNPDGTEKWEGPFLVEAAPVQVAPALASDGTLYVVVGDFASGGGVYAIDSETGEEEGFVELNSYSTASPTIGTDGTVYVGTVEGSIYAFDPLLDATTPWATLDGAVEGIAIDAEGTLYATGGNRLYAFDALGEEQWNAPIDLFLITPPVIGPDGHIFVGGAGEIEGAVYAFDGAGNELWSFGTDATVDAAPAVASNGTVYVSVDGGTDAQLLALDPEDGTQEWAFRAGERLDHAPVLAADGTVYLASAGGLFSVAPVRIDLDASQIPTPHIGEPVDVEIALPQGFQPETSTFYYRPTGATTYESLPLQPVGDGTVYAGTIPGEAVALRGIDFYAAFANTRLTVTYPQDNPETSPAWLPARFDELVPPGDFEPGTYRMISIPATVEAADLAAVFADYGVYEPRRWRVLRWTPQAEAYEELPALGDVPAVPGHAFWLVTREGESFTLGRGQATDASAPVELTLAPGWNQVGNPFAFPVSVAALDLPEAVEGPVGFDGAAYHYEVATLAPWAGYFLYNGSNEPITMTIPPVEVTEGDGTEAEALALAGKASSAREAAGYRMRLTAQLVGGALRDRENVIGLAEGADVGRDRMDYAEAPPVGDHVRLSILEGEERLAGSFKPTHGEGQWWDLEVTASVTEALPTRRRVQVRLEEEGTRPEDYRRYVIDREAGAAVAVEGDVFSVDLSREQPVRRLRVILGTPEFAEANAETAALDTYADALRPNYPNPFARTTTIPYELRTPGRVVVEVYNMLGQRVRTLVDAKQEAGAHEVRWDGRNAQGTPVASGVYFYRITAGSYEATRKLVLVR